MTVWEIAARKVPFADAANVAIVPNWVMQGEREAIPADCPSAVSQVITRSWDGVAANRPSLRDIIGLLKPATASSPIASSRAEAGVASGPNYQDASASKVASGPQYQLESQAPVRKGRLSRLFK